MRVAEPAQGVNINKWKKASKGREAAVSTGRVTMSGTEREEDKGKQNTKDPTRRDWLFKAGVAVNIAAGLMLAVPLIGFVFSSFVERKDPRSWISLGPLDGFPENGTRIATYRNPFTRPWDGQTANIPCWVRRLQGSQFQVFAINCTHLGCPVRWFPESGLFLCPCHGGAYYEDGSRAAGPPPRGLFQYTYKVENGELWVKGGEMPTLSNPV
jgi:Rieske Fe-S protein